jgi:hypothetical protein
MPPRMSSFKAIVGDRPSRYSTINDANVKSKVDSPSAHSSLHPVSIGFDWLTSYTTSNRSLIERLA